MASKGVPVHIYGDWDGSAVKRAQNDLSYFQKQANGFSGSIGKSFLGMGAAIGGAFAIGDIISKVTDFLQQAATAAIEDERSMVSLAKAMDNVGQGFANTEVEKFISDMALATGVADDQLRPAMSKLVTATGDAARAQDLLTTALDVSIGTGRDLASVSQAIARASTGQVSALTRLGIPLDQNIVKTKDFTAAVDVLNQRFGGQASAAADTYGGQLQRLQVAAGEAQETIGYALMDAVENLSEAMGGTGNLNDAILEGGEYVANFVAGMGLATIALTDFLGATDSANKGTQEVNSTFLDTGASFFKMVFHTNLATAALWDWTQRGADYRAEQERITAANDAATMRYQGMAIALGAASKSQEELAADAATAEESLKALAEEVKDLQANLSNRQALDDFAKSLRDLGEELKGNTLSFKGMSDSALENRDALRTAFSEAVSVIQGFVEEGRISESEFASVFAGTGRKIVDDFANQGFTRKEIRAFLKSEGLWTDELASIFSATKNKKALEESQRLGYNIASGISVGVSLGTPQVKTAMSGTVLAALQAAKDTAGIKSPSSVARDQIGIPIMDGIAKGLVDKSTDLKAATQTVVGDALNVAEGIISGWDAKIAEKLSNLESSKAAVTDWVTSTKNQLVSAFDLAGVFEASIDDQGKMTVATFQSGIKAGLDQFQWYTNVLTAIAQTPGSEQLVAFLQSQGIANGGSWGQALIDNGLVQYMVDNLGTVTTTADTTAQALVPPFLTSAQQSAQALYDAYVADYGKGGEKREKLQNLMDRLAKSLDRTSTITIKTVYEAAGIDGKRAAGGPVMAGKAYLVGERGPEVLVMGSQSGSIIPNGDLPMASSGYSAGKAAGGSPIYLTVNAGMGTQGAEVGRQIVDALKAYERRNGAVYVAA
jgi:hypothetical protein